MRGFRMGKVLAFFILFLFLGFSGFAFAQTAEDYFQQGKSALENQDLLTAHNNFQSALNLDLNHQGANLFYAITRILMISKSPNFNALLDRAGVSKSGRDIFNWTADFKRDPEGNIIIPSNSPTGAELQTFLKNNILPEITEINGALDNLSKVANNFEPLFFKWPWPNEEGTGVISSPNILTDNTKFWRYNEFIGYKLIIGGNEYTVAGNTEHTITVTPNWSISNGTYNYNIFEEVEIDYGDVLVFKGSLYTAKAGILVLNSYNLAIDIDKILSLITGGTFNIQNHLINKYKNLLTLLPGQKLSEAKDAFESGIDAFTDAIDFIGGETDTQDDGLFIIDDPEKKQEYLYLLKDLKDALNVTTLIRKIGLDVDLSKFFDQLGNLRNYLPTFLGSGFIERDSFPDPTFGGILPNMTSTELQEKLKKVIRESYSISPLALYDDFSGTYIDKTKWIDRELVREIDTVNQKLVLKHTSPKPPPGTSYPYIEFSGLTFTAPNTVTSIQADVAVTEYSIVNQASMGLNLGGSFYNDNSGVPGSDRTGDIQAGVSLGGPTGLYANWIVYRFTNASGTTYTTLGSGNFTTPNNSPIIPNTTYMLYVAYDQGANKFTFRVGAEEYTFGPTGLPPWVRNPNIPGKGPRTRCLINDASSSGYISLTLDNVYKNGFLYDNFSSTNIDSSKWAIYESVREISKGKLRSKTRTGPGPGYNNHVYNRLEFLYPSEINAIQAKVTPLDYHNIEGRDVAARIGGRFYNDGSSGGGLIGEVAAQVLIGGTGSNPVAEWNVWGYNDPQGNSIKLIESGTFKTPITLGKTYTLFLGWDGSQITFKVNKETAFYIPENIVNPPNLPWKEIGTRTLSPSGKESTIEALFDDVMVSGPVLSVSPKSYDFGNVIILTSGEETFTLSNTGLTSIGINSIDLVGGDSSMFNVTATCPTVPPKANCLITTSFSPTSEGVKSTTLRIVINTPDYPALYVPLYVPLIGTGILETISTPSSPTGLSNGTTGTTYTYTTGGSSSNLGLGHPIQYLFEWGDGTNSGWLPVGKTSASKVWTSDGSWLVKVKARCETHSPVESVWSPEVSVNITIPIHSVSPPTPSNNTLFRTCSLYPPNPPQAFQWTPDPGELFTRYEIQFSPNNSFTSIPVKVRVTTTTSTLTNPIWQKVLAIPGLSGGTVYWRIVGTRANKTIATSETGSIIVDPPKPVENPQISHSSKTTTPPPKLSWLNNCNTKFKVWFGNDPDFAKPGMKKTSIAATDSNPYDNSERFELFLTSGQWIKIRNVVGDVPGSTIYWYVESWDVLKRYTKTDVLHFDLSP